MQTGLICFELIARINQVAVDIRSVVRENGITEEEIATEQLVKIIRGFGFKAKIKRLGLERLNEKYPLPALAVLKDNSKIALLKIDSAAKKVFCFHPTEKQAKELTFEEFTNLATGDFVILRHKLIDAQIKFGFKWFFNEIRHYRLVMSQVLLGSFIVQLFALTTPLFTQVILDKVLVHHSIITLDILAVAFIVVTLFDLVLNLARKYIFIHTACKIDAKLGARLFRHLFALPFVYFESRKVGNIAARVRELDQIREFITNKSVSVLIDLFFSVIFIGIMFLYLGVKLVINNELTIGQLIAFNMFSGQFTGPVLRLVGLWNEFQQALLGVDRLGDILNHPVEIQSSKLITLPALSGSVRFDEVSFRYQAGTPPALNRLSFTIKPGMSVGIVGPSGSGKSTVTKLIQRLYTTNEGAIYLDDIDVRHVNSVWLRSNIGVVLQENYLFSGTIRENIAMPKPDAPMELILQVARIAGAHEFIAQMPEGYDTVVGERGSTLSGGQKQRVAIARALITNPPILIFDEATSALDYESERIILGNLEQIKKGRTTFIIAHRLSAVRKCNLILVLERGELTESGTHAELLAQQGYYHHLLSQQGSDPLA